MASFENRPGGQQYRCTACKQVKHRNQFSAAQIKEFNRRWHGQTRLGASTAMLAIKCKPCAQGAHVRLTQHSYKCDSCQKVKPATPDCFGPTQRNSHASRHICLRCENHERLKDVHSGDELDEEELGLPDGLSEDEVDMRPAAVIRHDDEEAIEAERQHRAECERLLAQSTRTVETAGVKNERMRMLQKAQEEEFARFQTRRLKYGPKLRAPPPNEASSRQMQRPKPPRLQVNSEDEAEKVMDPNVATWGRSDRDRLLPTLLRRSPLDETDISSSPAGGSPKATSRVKVENGGDHDRNNDDEEEEADEFDELAEQIGRTTIQSDRDEEYVRLLDLLHRRTSGSEQFWSTIFTSQKLEPRAVNTDSPPDGQAGGGKKRSAKRAPKSTRFEAVLMRKFEEERGLLRNTEEPPAGNVQGWTTLGGVQDWCSLGEPAASSRSTPAASQAAEP